MQLHIPDASPRKSQASRSTHLEAPLVPLILVTALFFLWGIPNNLNDILIRQFMKSLTITRFEAGLVQSAFYMGYFLIATPAALLMRRFSYKFGFLAGLGIFGAGAFLFWPAAVVGQYWFFLCALFIMASGLAFLETASNPFIAQAGDPATAAQRLNIAQAFNPLGSITGVIVGTVFIFSGVELSPPQVTAMQVAGTYQAYLRHETMRIVAPYMAIGAFAIVWAILIAFAKFPAIVGEHHDSETGQALEEKQGSYKELLGFPLFFLAIFAQFMYVGAQVGTWSYFIQYVQDSTHQPEKVAGYFLTGTLGAFAVGRFVSAAIMRRIKPYRLMAIYSVLNVILVAIGVMFPSWTGLWAIFLTSFFMSVMYPTIFALGIAGLGRNTKIGGSLIVMSIVGGAVLTPLMGWIAQSSHRISLAYTVPLVGYVVVAIYSFIGQSAAQRKELQPF